MNKFFFLGFILGMNVLGGGCTFHHHYPKIEGRVFDSHSGFPIKDAAVVRIYNVRQKASDGEDLKHIDVTETRTNTEGKFSFKDKRILAPSISYTGFCEEPLFYIFSPGYEVFTGDSPLSHFDFMKTILGEGSYRIQARTILSQTMNGKTKVYTFRLSPLKTPKKRLQNLCYSELDVDSSLIPYYKTLLNNENQVYGKYAWNK